VIPRMVARRPLTPWTRLHLAAGMALLLGACATSPEAKVPHAKRTRMMVARSESKVILEWESSPRVYYTVLYSDTPQVLESWLPLEEAWNLPGNGQTMTLHLALPPQAALRKFDLVATARPLQSVTDLRKRRTGGP